MRNKATTQQFYLDQLGFQDIGTHDYPGYLIVQKDQIEIHFFEFPALKQAENYGQVYIRLTNIDSFYRWLTDRKVVIHPNGALQARPWGQREFSILDPDNNLLTFGEARIL